MTRKTTLLLPLIAFLAAGVMKLQAQNLIVRFQSGTEKSESISAIQKLSFNNGNLLLSYKTGAVDSYPLPDIQKLYFGIPAAVQQPVTAENSGLKVYPNPSAEYIHLLNVPAEDFVVFIYRMDGKLMLKSYISPGNDTLDISNLPSGIYLLMLNGETVKFIKL